MQLQLVVSRGDSKFLGNLVILRYVGSWGFAASAFCSYHTLASVGIFVKRLHKLTHDNEQNTLM